MIRFGIIIGLILTIGSSYPASATSLDELYRDIVRSDNSGYLPLYVKNRNAPEFLFDDSELKSDQPNPELLPVKEDDLSIDFGNHRKQQDMEEIAQKLLWQQSLEAIKANKVTPVALGEVERRAAQDDPTAVEVYAYMYAKGIGVKADLIKAFGLYQRADKLGVKNALQNAAQVYKAMNFDQRAALSPFAEQSED